MRKKQVCLDFVQERQDCVTAQAFITSDSKDNQITAFHPGAMQYAEENNLEQFPKMDWAIIAPDNPLAMLRFAHFFS